MSTMTGIGPALRIDGPPPVRREYTLLSIPGVRVDGEGRWENGVNVWGYPDEVPSAWEPCAAGTYRDKEEGGEQPQARFDPVGLYVPITCSAMNVGDWRDFAGRAQKVLDATLSHGVEEVLAEGVALSTNPYLGDANVAILAGNTAQTPEAALRYLEEALGATGRQGLIHASPPVIAGWSEFLSVDEQFEAVLPDGTTVTGEALVTVNGTPVAAGSGYIGASANGQVPNAGTAYAFVSGPVQVRVSDPTLVGPDINGSMSTSLNDVTFRAERFVLAEWDTALQAAVLVDWTCDVQCPQVIA